MMYGLCSKERRFSYVVFWCFLSSDLTLFVKKLSKHSFFTRFSLQASQKRALIFLVSFVILPSAPLLALPPAYDPIVEGELLSLRKSILVATNAEPDIATWVRQQLGEGDTSRDASLDRAKGTSQDVSSDPHISMSEGVPSLFLSQLKAPEEIMETGDREADLFTLIQTLSTTGTAADAIDKPYRDMLKGYYQGYLQTLQTLKTPEEREQHLAPKVIMQSEIMGPYRITQAMAYQLLSTNIYGDIVRGDHGGSHPVHRLENVFFKSAVRYDAPDMQHNNMPLQPAMEAGMYHAYRLLFGEGYMVPTNFMTFSNVQVQAPDMEQNASLTKRQKEIIHNNTSSRQLESYLLRADERIKQSLTFKKHFTQQVAQGSLAIDGRTLLAYAQQAHETGTPLQLDKRSYSAHVLGSYIFPTQDAKFDNFMAVEDQETDRVKIVGIDNDLALEPALLVGEGGEANILNLKNGLYLLRDEMHHAIDPSLQLFINQTPADLFLVHWLKALDDLDNSYNTLLKQGMMSQADYDLNGFPFMLSSEQLLQVGKNLLTFQTLFQETFYAKRVTHQQLLKTLYPDIAGFYKPLQDHLCHEGHHGEAPVVEDTRAPIIAVQFDNIFNEAHPIVKRGKGWKGNSRGRPVKGRLLDGKGRASPEKGRSGLSHALQTQASARKKPIFEAINEVIAKFVLSHKRDDWDQVLETLGETFPNRAKAFITSMQYGQESLKQALQRPEMLMRALDNNRGVGVLSSMMDLGFDVRPHTAAILHRIIKSTNLKESKALDWLDVLYQHKVDLESFDEERHDTALDVAFQMKKPPFIHSLIGLGAGRRLKLHSALSYIESLSAAERQAFDPYLEKLEHRNIRLKWELMLEAFLPRKNTPLGVSMLKEGGIELQTTQNTRVLSLEMMSQLWEDPTTFKGFKRINPYGRRNVGRIVQGRYSMYVKEHPELPGIEEAVGILTRSLLGFGAPHTLLAKLGSTGPDKSAYLFSEGIEGDNFQNIFTGKESRSSWEASWRGVVDRIDPYAYSGIALVAMLINPEDGKPDNYILHPQENGVLRLVGVDNDHAFVPSVSAVKKGGKRKHRVQVKSVLFTMDQMNNPVHAKIREQFLYYNPRGILSKWIQQLSGLKYAYEELFSPKEAQKYFKSTQSFVGMAVMPDTIHRMYRNLVDLQYLIDRNPDLTHMDILRKFNQPLHARYQKGFTIYPGLNPYERFLELDGGDYAVDKKTKSLMTTRHAQQLLSSVQLGGKTFLEYIKEGRHHEISPEAVLLKLTDLAERDMKDTVRAVMANGGSDVALEEMTDNQKEDFFRRLDWSKLPLPAQQALLQKLTTVPFRGVLTLKNCAALSEKLMQKLPWDTITSVRFEIDEGSSPKAVNKCLKSVPEGTTLILKLKNQAYLTDYWLDHIVEGAHLNKLELENCPIIADPELRQKKPNLSWKDGMKETRIVQTKIRIVQTKIRDAILNNKTELDLGGDRIGGAGAKALAAAFEAGDLKNTALTKLDLRDNSIGDVGAKALSSAIASGGLKGTVLTTLILGDNHIGDAGAKALSSAIASGGLKGSALTSLDLWRNCIGAEGAQALAAAFKAGALKECSLTRLDLHGNNIGNEGAKALAAAFKAGALTDSFLTSLDLGNNGIGDEGAKALAQAFKAGALNRLTGLYLERNYIGNEGAKALAAAFKAGALKDSFLTTLNMNDNYIGAESLAALDAAIKGCCLTVFTTRNVDLGDEYLSKLAFAMSPKKRSRIEDESVNLLPTLPPKKHSSQEISRQEGEERKERDWESSSKLSSLQRVEYMLLDPHVDYRRVMDFLMPELYASSEVRDFVEDKIAPFYPQAYLDLAREVGRSVGEGDITAQSATQSSSKDPASMGVDRSDILLGGDLPLQISYIKHALNATVPEVKARAVDALKTLYDKTRDTSANESLNVGVDASVGAEVLLELARVYRGEYADIPSNREEAIRLYEEGIHIGMNAGIVKDPVTGGSSGHAYFDAAHYVSEFQYQLAILYLDDTSESLKAEELLQSAIKQGHVEAHLLWQEMNSQQDALVLSEEDMFDQGQLDHLREAQDIHHVLYHQQRKSVEPSATPLYRVSSSQKRGMGEVIISYQGQTAELESQLQKTMGDLEDLSRLSPHYKRLKQKVMSIENALDALEHARRHALELIMMREKGHYDNILGSRQYRFYESLFKTLKDQLEIKRLVHAGLVDAKESLGDRSMKSFMGLVLDQTVGFAVESIPIPGSGLLAMGVQMGIEKAAEKGQELLVDKGVALLSRKKLQKAERVAALDVDKFTGLVSATYTYRLQELVPLLTEKSQDILARELSLNFLSFMGKEQREEEDITTLLSESFYHQKKTMGKRLKQMRGKRVLQTVYKEEIPVASIYGSALLRESDGSEWRSRNQSLQDGPLTVNGIPVCYQIPLLEVPLLKGGMFVKSSERSSFQHAARALYQVTPPQISPLQREIMLPQDSEMYLKRAFQFVGRIKDSSGMSSA